MSAAADVVVRYEEIASDYEKNLQTQLRGFKQAHEFLDMWVHDADPVRSILSIVEAAESGGLAAVGVEIGPETLKGIDTARLLDLVGKVGKASLSPRGSGSLLHVDLA